MAKLRPIRGCHKQFALPRRIQTLNQVTEKKLAFADVGARPGVSTHNHMYMDKRYSRRQE